MVSSKALRLRQAADGRLQLCFASPLGLMWLRLKLRLLHGFRTEGKWIVGAGESIAPDLVRGELRLQSGGDDLAGHYLLSCCDAGDEFVRSLLKKPSE
jgi:hypothetical protein